MASKVAEYRHRLVAKEFFVDCDVSAAYARVYDTKRPAVTRAAASRLLTNVNFIKYLQEEFASLQQRLELQQDQALLEICLLAYSSLKSVASWGPDGVVLKESDSLDDDIARTVQDVQSVKRVRTYMQGEVPVTEEETRTRIKLHAKTQALKMLQEFFRLGDPLSGEVEAKLKALVLIMAQYVSREQLAAFRAHVATTLGVSLPADAEALPGRAVQRAEPDHA